MRRSTLAVLATVSLATLVSVATASQAVQPSAVILGVLKPTEEWKVGTVQAGDTSFCAMVTKYESGVGLAFARTPDGYGTVAMNLNQGAFTTGDNYDVKLEAQGAKARTLKARATSDRSIVVQIGQDKALYDALKGNGDLELSMPAADVKFTLNGFSHSFKSLVSCADGLGGKGNGPKVASAKVQDVEQDSLAPIDREVQKLSEGKAPEGKVAEAGAQPKAVTDGETSLDAQLDAAALGAPGADNAKIAAVTAAPAADATQPKVERKLLASAHSDTPVVPPSDSGSMAKHWDSQQQSAAAAKSKADQDKAALQQAVADREAKIAALDADKSAAASREVAEFDRKQKLLDDQTAALHQQDGQAATDKSVNAKTAAAAPVTDGKKTSDAGSKQASVSEDDETPAVEQKPAATTKAAKAGLVAKTAALARIDAQRQQQREELDSKLASNQSTYQNKIAALEAERDSLKAHLAETSEKTGKLEKQEADEGSQLASARAEISNLKAEAAQKLASLEKSLSDRTAALDVMQKQGDGRTSALVKEHRALTDQLDEKNAQVAELEKKLADIKAAKAVETAKADVKTDTVAGRRSLVIVNDDAPVAGHATDASGALEKAQAEVAELRMKNAALSEQAALAASGTVSAADRKALESQQADMAKAQAEVAELRARNNELAAQVAEAHNAPVPGTDKIALEAARSELADLRAKNEALSAQAAKAQTATAGEPAAKVALDSQRADLDKAQAELADLKSKNADLSGKLSAAQVDAQHQLAQTEAQEHAKLQEAQAEIASLRAARAANEQKLAAVRTEAETPAPAKAPAAALHVVSPQEPARSLAETEPSSGNAVASSSQGGDVALVAPTAPVAAVASVAAAAPAPAAKGAYDENRAAAFLDKIMAYHRPVGAPVHASASLASSQPVFGHGSSAGQTAAAPVHPVAASADSFGVMSAMPGDAASAPAVSAALAPAPLAAPKTVATGNGLPIEKLLSTSGVDASFKADTASNAGVRQWTAGNLNGMYEQMPAGNFETLAQNYIGRYRQDCPGKLDVTMSHPQVTAAGTLERANVSCGIPSNSYSTSFVFVQEGGKFGAILHTGYPEDAAKVRAIGDNIASALGSSGGVSEAPVATKAEASVPSVSHHFTIPAVTSQQ